MRLRFCWMLRLLNMNWQTIVFFVGMTLICWGVALIKGNKL